MNRRPQRQFVLKRLRENHPGHNRRFDTKGNPEKLLKVMKFGGTSLADASCINRVIEIIRAATIDADLVVVVSAMSGVTDSLVEATASSNPNERAKTKPIFEALRKRHETTLETLIYCPSRRARIREELRKISREAENLCLSTHSANDLARRDKIISIGERLSARLLAAALRDRGTKSEALDATALIVTDRHHGEVIPDPEATRTACAKRLSPFLRQSVVPVVTGFIGATPEGVLTTLGRNSSDYSATLLAAAMSADEVIIWTDVDGILTADPRSVPDACPIAEISYREAATLAHFGAKVLHPKTLSPLMMRGIPMRIRNTFAPELHGTKITPDGADAQNPKAAAVIEEVALVRIGGQDSCRSDEVLERARTVVANSGVEPIVFLHSPSKPEIHMVIPRGAACRTTDALRRSLIKDKLDGNAKYIVLDATVALITLIGQGRVGKAATIIRVFEALSRAKISVVAADQRSSDQSLSVVVAQPDAKAALVAIHREFQMSRSDSSHISSVHSGHRSIMTAEVRSDDRSKHQKRGPRYLSNRFAPAAARKIAG